MKFLLDTRLPTFDRFRAEYPDLVRGQLMTPYFFNLLDKHREKADRCLFVCLPDIVGNAKLTLDIWQQIKTEQRFDKYPLAYVAQDGSEAIDIPWQEFSSLFVGGTTHWKDSAAVQDLVKAALILQKHVHIGRVNQVDRYLRFAEAGAHTCDGSGASQYSEKLRDIDRAIRNNGRSAPLLDYIEEKEESNQCG